MPDALRTCSIYAWHYTCMKRHFRVHFYSIVSDFKILIVCHFLFCHFFFFSFSFLFCCITNTQHVKLFVVFCRIAAHEPNSLCPTRVCVCVFVWVCVRSMQPNMNRNTRAHHSPTHHYPPMYKLYTTKCSLLACVNEKYVALRVPWRFLPCYFFSISFYFLNVACVIVVRAYSNRCAKTKRRILESKIG